MPDPTRSLRPTVEARLQRGAWSLRRKLILVTTGVTLFALVLLGLITVTFEWYRGREALSRQLATQAEIIGANSVVALSFESAANAGGKKKTLVTDFDASETLQTLRANRHIVAACIYSKSGKVLARYARPGAGADEARCPDRLAPGGVAFAGGYASLSRPIVEPDGETVGTVCLRSDLDELYAGVRTYAAIIGAVALACLLLAFLLSVWLHDRIAAPVLSLARAAEVVSANRDYTIRAEGRSTDELGLLVTAFNEMLATIQRRDAELQVITAKLEEHSSSLEEMVNQRTADLARATEEARDARDRALEASRAKSQFLANMSHEIRTPLNAIIGLTDLGLRADPPARVSGYLDKVATASRTLLALINDILDFSKIEARKLELRPAPFELRALLSRVASVVGEAASSKGLALRTSIDDDVPGWLEGDALRLEQVLTNLAGNAVKFTERGSVEIAVRVVDSRPGHATLALAVADTGIGIRDELIPGLFASFAQGDGSMSRKHGGTGLGLSISRRLVQLMHGEIGVESVEGRGSTFSFTVELPLASEADAVAEAADRFVPNGDRERRAREAIRGARILLAEDIDTNREIVQTLLGAAGVEVAVAVNGREAVAAVAGERRFDAVLMDLQMPEMDGYEATRAIRADPRHAELPIIALTAHATTAERASCLAAGMNDHVSKPIDVATLFAVLARWITVEEGRSRSGPLAVIPRRRGPTLPVGLAGIDRDQALDRVSGNQGLLRKLLVDFGARHEGAAERLRAALGRGDREGARRQIHGLKGLSGNLGATALYQASLALEAALKVEGPTDEPLERFARALAEVVETAATLGPAAPAERQTPPAAALDPARIGAQVAELLALVERNRLDARQHWAPLRQLLAGHEDPEELTRVDESLGRLDFRAAQAALRRLAGRAGIETADATGDERGKV